MRDLAETYLTRAEECRRLAGQADGIILIRYLTELADALEAEAEQIRLKSLPSVPIHE
jgi:hypothetical protein